MRAYGRRGSKYVVNRRKVMERQKESCGKDRKILKIEKDWKKVKFERDWKKDKENSDYYKCTIFVV